MTSIWTLAVQDGTGTVGEDVAVVVPDLEVVREEAFCWPGGCRLALAFLAACGAAQTTSPPSSSSTTSSVAPTALPTSSTATKNGVTVKVTLSRTRVQAGDTIAGTVAVTNATKTSITRPLACKDSVLTVALSDGKLTTAWAWTLEGCNHAFAFKPGTTTTLPVSVITSYNAKNVFGPLPAGRYQAKLYLNQFPLPVPAVIPVVVSAAARTTDQSTETDPSPQCASQRSACGHPSGEAVPPEFRSACGHPGAQVEVRKVPVNISHAACDLTGVTLSYRNYGGVTVTVRGGDIGNSLGFVLSADPKTLDVAVTASGVPGNQ